MRLYGDTSSLGTVVDIKFSSTNNREEDFFIKYQRIVFNHIIPVKCHMILKTGVKRFVYVLCMYPICILYLVCVRVYQVNLDMVSRLCQRLCSIFLFMFRPVFIFKKYKTFLRVDIQLYQHEWKLEIREIVCFEKSSFSNFHEFLASTSFRMSTISSFSNFHEKFNTEKCFLFFL